MSATLLLLLSIVAPGATLLVVMHLGVLLLGLCMQVLTVLPFTWSRRLPLSWRWVGYVVCWGGSLLVYLLFA